jgi:hypothetical protein
MLKHIKIGRKLKLKEAVAEQLKQSLLSNKLNSLSNISVVEDPDKLLKMRLDQIGRQRGVQKEQILAQTVLH